MESKHSVRLTGPVVFMVLGVLALGVGVGMVLNAGDPETPYGHGQIPASKAKTEDVSGKAPPERPKTAFLDASKTAHAPPKEPEVSGAREDYARKQLDLLLMEQRAGKTAPDALRRKFEDFLRSYSTTKAGQEAATVLKALPAAPLPPEVTEKIGLPFKATFDASLKGWRVFDVSGLKEGPSRWVGKGSSVVQETNAFGPPLTVDGRDVGGGGSHLILQGGEFREGKLQLHVLPNDDDGLGVLFHHRDEANYYRFYMRAESRLATLICLSHGQITELARSFFAYNPRTAKEVEILWGAGRMQVLVDKRDLFGIVPEPPPASNQGGTVGLGSYGNAGGSYGDLRVDPLLAAERQALLDGKLLSPGSSTASTGRESPYTARWSKLALDGPGPGRRPYLVTAMTYDRKRKRSVLYGGEYQNDLWALDLDAHKWTCLLPNDPKGPETGKTRPPATIQHNFHYDEGQDLYWLNFAWCYDPNAKTWQEQKQLIRNAQVPINSINQGMLYDPDGKRFLINGDGGQSNIWFFLYPGDRKIEPLPSVTPAWVWRYGGLFYDSTRKAFVVFPCVNFGDDTWVLDAKTRQWRELRPEVRPQPRTYHRLVFDERLGVGVMAGGRDKDNKSFMDLWVYETAAERWIAVPYQGEAPSGDAACAATAYDAAHDVTVYLDGNGNTWTLELKLNAAIPTKTVVPEAALVTEPSKPATPSSDGPGIGEVGHTDADGWITAFNGKDLQGWGVYNEPARVEAGAMVLEGKSDIGWRLNREDYEIRGQLQVERASASNYFGTIKLHRAGGAIASLALKADGGVSCAQDNNKIQEAPGVLKPMQWQSFQLRVVNGRLDFSLAGKEILTSAVPKVMATMLNLFGSFDAKQSSRWRLKELAWRPLDAGGKPVRLPAAKEAGQKDPEGWVCLFNERDLSGWETLRGKPQAAEGALHLKGADEISLPLAETDFEVRGEVQLYDKAPNQHVGSLAIRRPGKDRKGGLLLAWFWDGTLQLKDENDKVIAKSNGAKTGVWQPFVIRAKGAEVGVDVDGRTVMTAKTAPTGAGNLALYGPEAGLSHFAFRNLSYRSPQSVAAPEKAPEPAPSPPPSTSTQSIPAPKAAKDSILWETWNAIPGPAVASLTQHYAYPYFPMEARELTSFETPANHGDNFGARVCGFVHPPLDGSYVFWIASDDESQLWLSTDEDRKHLRKIAEVKGYRGVREWEKDGGQKSAAIPLKAGQRYRIEALHKEGAGEDHLAVGWQLPDGTQERPIPGSRLSSGTPLNWVTLDIATASSKKTETQFIKQKDGSILVSGAVLRNDTYAIATRPNLKNIVAIRLDVLPDETLPARGPGRADNGNFVLTDLKVFADGRLIEIQNARSDYSQNGYSVSNAIDDKADTGWAVGGQLGKPHSATFEPVQPFHAVSLGFLLAHDSEHLNYNIGRFRISVAADPEGKP
ncbi:MAG: PA14 domain-containing protein [Planctomycetota bacterium]|nr:PA14 domain-containing protein [Planctomycetota bacterium]